MNKQEIFLKLQSILDTKEDKRYLIAVSGIPGSGKTTLVNQIVDEFNELHSSKPCIAVPMDGFHIPQSQLDAQQLARRGAYFTFDASLLISFIKELKTTTGTTLYAPSFDHTKGDPVDHDIPIEPHHQIILMEGIYLHLKQPSPWNEIPLLFDEKWFIPISIQDARERVGKRHYNSHLVGSVEEGFQRFDNNDKLNAEFILKNRVENDIYYVK